MHDIINRKELDMDVFDKNFMYNILWVLKTYQPACQQFVWLGNTANGNEGIDPTYLQTVENMEECDTDVKKAIGSDPELQSIVSFIDVHDASMFRPHVDFVHMGEDWCTDLGNWLTPYM